MKRKTNLIFGSAAFVILLTMILGCKLFSGSGSTDNTAKPANDVKKDVPNSETAPSSKKTNIEKSDFTVTAEDLDKEFTRKGVKADDLKKYAAKNIAVSGRVSMLSMEKQGTTQPWVTLYAPGVLHGVSCYFDDDNLEQMKRLKMDKIVKIQGFKDDFIVPEVSPRLEHCFVIEAN